MKTEILDYQGLRVKDVSGRKVGEVSDFFYDVPSSEPEWLAVTAGLLDKKQVVVPLKGVWREGDELIAAYTKSQIMEAPIVKGPAIDAEKEAELYRHYRVPRELPGDPQSREVWEQHTQQAAEYRLRSWKAMNSIV